MTVFQTEDANAIVERALGWAEHRSRFAGLEDQSAEAKAARLRYDTRRRGVLESLDWNFARRRVVPSVRTDLTPPPDLPVAFARPANARRIRDVLTGITPQRWRAEVGIFAQSSDDAQIVFTGDETSPVLFPAHFVQALEFLLAAEFALNFARSANRSKIMLDNFRDAMREADIIEAQEQSADSAYARGPLELALATGDLGV